jgi:predicted LPLAT superfamily acyltransferase
MGLSQRIAIIVLEVWLAAIAAYFLVVAGRAREALSG